MNPDSCTMMTATNAVHDEVFYFSNVTLKVEETLFRVPRYAFENSSDVFRDMFSLPSDAEAAEGSCDEHPIVLEGVSLYDFRQLLRAMFCRSDALGVMPREDPPTTLQEWTSVLKLAHRWEMTALHQYACKRISKLDSVDSVEKLSLALTYDINAWIRPNLQAIARREEPLGQRDIDILGVDIVLRLARARERVAGLFGSCANAHVSYSFDLRVSEVFPEYFQS